MKDMEQLLKKIDVAEPRTFAALTVYPLLGPLAQQQGYRVLDDAIRDGTARVTEISDAGSVPQLAFVNEGDTPVLLVDGEELAGAKQNRVLNLTVLAPPKSTLVIPVSCVEAGRWSSVSPAFMGTKQVMYSSGRMKKSAQVSGSLKRMGRALSDQAAVWDDVSDLLESHRVQSPTSRMRDVFDERRREIEDYIEAFPIVDGQVGGAFALAGSLRGVEFFDSQETLQKLFPKLVRSWALDALVLAERAHAVPAVEDVRGFLDEVAGAKLAEHQGIGLGKDVRLTGERLTGGALIHGERPVHLCAFRLDAEGEQPPGWLGRMASASSRSRQH